ncbi:MAG: hypothetical protein ABI900_12835, partial [Betaproteobacteria bacterium]
MTISRCVIGSGGSEADGGDALAGPSTISASRQPTAARAIAGCRSDVEIAHAERIILDECAARLDVLAHQRR